MEKVEIPPPSAPETGRLRRLMLVGIKTAVSVALLWLLFSTYDISDAMDRIYAVDTGFLALAVAAELSAICLATVRWRIILAAMGLRLAYPSALLILYIGLFFNQVLPSNLGGDAMRVWRLVKRGSDMVYAIGSVMLDRIIALLALVVLVFACLPFAPSLTEDPLLLRVLIGIFAVTAAGLVFLMSFDRLLPLTRWLLPEALIPRLVRLSGDIRRFLLGLSASLPALAISLVNHVILVAMLYALARGLHIKVGFVECLVLMPPVVLISMLPISFAGWGVREGAMIAALGFVGVPPGEAIALSVIFGLILVLTSLPGGIIWYATGNRRRSD